MEKEKQEPKKFDSGRPEDFYSNAPEDSLILTLAEILRDRGLNSIRIGESSNGLDNDKGIFASNKAREIMRSIVHGNAEFNLLWITHDIPDHKLNFEKITLEPFKDATFQIRLEALKKDRHAKKLKEIFGDFSGHETMRELMEEDEADRNKLLNRVLSVPGKLPSEDEIRGWIELIVDSRLKPEDFEEEDGREEQKRSSSSSKATLRAHEVADLDPYGVRK